MLLIIDYGEETPCWLIKKINIQQIFRRDGRDALTNVPLASVLMLFDKAKDRIRDSANCLIKRIKETCFF